MDSRTARLPRPPARWLTGLVLLASLVAIAACTSGEPEEPPSPVAEDPQFERPVWEGTAYGLHMDLTFDTDPEHRREAIERAAELGVQISRNSFLWDRLQPTGDQEIDWSVPDAVVQELTAGGIEPMFTAYGSPTWASGTPEGTEDARTYVPQDDAAFDEWVSRYADVMREAAERYRGQVTKWEVWNEQNEHHFWKPQPDVDRYIEFFQAVRTAIKQGNPDAQIAPGGLAGISATGDGNIRGADFLRQMLDRGVRPEYVSIHPYTSEGQGPDEHHARQNNFDDIQRIRDVLVEAGHDVPVWVTEWGWPSDQVGQDTQAEYVARSLEKIATDYRYVTVATYFVDHDRSEFSHGLLDADLQRKPAADAFERFMATRR